MYARTAKPNLDRNGIKHILQFILTVLALQNVRIAEEEDFVREKISVVFFVNTRKKILHVSAGFLLFASYRFTLT